MLSNSFFSASEAIHRKNRIAGDTSRHDREIQARSACKAAETVAVHRRSSLAHIQQQHADQQDQDEEEHDDGRPVAQVVIGEGRLVQQDVQRLAHSMCPARRV